MSKIFKVAEGGGLAGGAYIGNGINHESRLMGFSRWDEIVPRNVWCNRAMESSIVRVAHSKVSTFPNAIFIYVVRTLMNRCT